jgi:hypothetical protein
MPESATGPHAGRCFGVFSEAGDFWGLGSALGWLRQVTDFYVRAGGIQNPVPASGYFDTKLFLDTVKA